MDEGWDEDEEDDVGIELDLGQARDQGDAEATEDEDDRGRHAADLGETDQQCRREEEEENELDVAHAHNIAQVADLLAPPLERDVDHVRGEWGGPLELTMFGDFQCPYCLASQSVLRRVRDRLGDRLLFAFRHLPIPERHPIAPMAAEASESAAAQGRFWDFHDALFAAQAELSRETILRVGGEIGLDATRMEAELEAGTWRRRVERDLRSAEASSARGTPTFFVNGVRHDDYYDAGSLVEALEGGEPLVPPSPVE